TEVTLRDPIPITPKDFDVPAACGYEYHVFRFVGSNGKTYMTPTVKGQTLEKMLTYQEYRGDLLPGAYQVTMKIITTNCGETAWIKPKPILIVDDGTNRPPYFEIGFFDNRDTTGIYPLEVVEVGDKLNLRVITNPYSTPPSPSDPDGDTFTYYWYFDDTNNTDWIKAINKSGSYIGVNDSSIYRNLRADVIGIHRVRAVITDSMGASYEASTYVEVTAPNPKPKITGAKEVKEGRLIKPAISGEKSYSPLGRKIQTYIWQVFDENGQYTGTALPTKLYALGNHKMTLEVIDSAGLRSLPEDMDTHTLQVIPDEPPVPLLVYPEKTYRQLPIMLENKSFSRDGDIIAKTWVNWSYDSNGNGDFDDEEQHEIFDDVGSLVFTPSKLGQIRFRVY
ncbi:hypothetical protein WBG83_22385, partial [Paenibacillus sp. y28]